MKLIGISKKGKERIKRDGDEWVVLRVEDRVLFSSDPGPWLFVIPPNGDERASRWIHKTRDPNFEIVQ